MIFVYIKKSSAKKILILMFTIIIGVIILKFGSTSVFNYERKLPIYSVDTDSKKVAITFDISWGEDNTEKILKILEEQKIKATFFIVGAWIDEHPDILKKICESGHEIGNHTNNHPDMYKISKNKLISNIEAADEKIKNITGKSTELFRCPSGVYNNYILNTVEEMKKIPIQWSVDSIDWRNDGAEIEYNRVISKTRPGSIILFHNTGKYTPYNLIKITNNLQKQGYKFVTVSDLIYKKHYYVNNEGKQISDEDIVN